MSADEKARAEAERSLTRAFHEDLWPGHAYVGTAAECFHCREMLDAVLSVAGAADHRNACSGSNEPGQAGSLYP